MTTLNSERPIIILGMHRSGTSMTSGLLRQMGLFVGADLFDDIHNESTYFKDINSELLKSVSAGSDSTTNFKYLLGNPEILKMTLRCLEYDVRSSKAKQFFGSHVSLDSIDTKWGWKDPQTMITIPLWLKIFPEAKIVYITRNGVDVASSLRVRELKILERRKRKHEKNFKKRFSLKTKLQSCGFKGPARNLSLDGGFSLWEEYVEAAEKTIREMENERIIIKYEDVLNEPVKHLRELADFCGLKSDKVETLASTIRPGRGSAYLKDPELKEFYDKVKNTKWMVAYGY